MECPVCGLISPPNSSRCDCGYDFNNRTGGRRPPLLALRPILPSLSLAWLVVTLGDLLTLAMSGGPASFPNALFNLFTPIMLWTILGKPAMLSITVPLLFLGLMAGDLLGKQIRMKRLRFAYNLMVLLALTTAIDLINWGSPKSIEQFLLAFGGKR